MWKSLWQEESDQPKAKMPKNRIVSNGKCKLLLNFERDSEENRKKLGKSGKNVISSRLKKSLY